MSASTLDRKLDGVWAHAPDFRTQDTHLARYRATGLLADLLRVVDGHGVRKAEFAVRQRVGHEAQRIGARRKAASIRDPGELARCLENRVVLKRGYMFEEPQQERSTAARRTWLKLSRTVRYLAQLSFRLMPSENTIP